MRLERRLRVKTAIDMTPLVDVILMLVLFFLITSTFKTVPGIQIALPPFRNPALDVLRLSHRKTSFH